MLRSTFLIPSLLFVYNCQEFIRNILIVEFRHETDSILTPTLQTRYKRIDNFIDLRTDMILRMREKENKEDVRVKHRKLDAIMKVHFLVLIEKIRFI